MTLLHEDAVQSMPPFAMWIQGAANIGTLDGPARTERLPGVSRCCPRAANGCPAFGQYKPDPAGGYAPWALQVLEISGGRDHRDELLPDSCWIPTRLFPEFGLPAPSRRRRPASSSRARITGETSARVMPPPRRPASSARRATSSTAPRSGGPGPFEQATSEHRAIGTYDRDSAPALGDSHRLVDGRQELISSVG